MSVCQCIEHVMCDLFMMCLLLSEVDSFIWFLRRLRNYFVWCCIVNFDYATFVKSFRQRIWCVDDDEKFPDIMHPCKVKVNWMEKSMSHSKVLKKKKNIWINIVYKLPQSFTIFDHINLWCYRWLMAYSWSGSNSSTTACKQTNDAQLESNHFGFYLILLISFPTLSWQNC